MRSRTLLIGLLLAAAAAALFWPVRAHEFLNWDDLTYVSTNDHVRGGLTWDGIAWAFTHSYSSNWHPLTWLSHMLDCQLFGLNPGAHHLVNLGFHIANTLLLFGLLRRLTGALWRSALVAALFALHPLHVESVAWVAERKDLLSTFFFLLTLLAYTRYVTGGGWRVTGGRCQVSPEQRPGPAPSTKHQAPSSGLSTVPSISPPSSVPWYLASLVLFALGLMSKPMLVTVPFVLLVLDYWPLGRLRPSAPGPVSSGAQAVQGSRSEVQGSKFKVQGSRFVPLLRRTSAPGPVTSEAQAVQGSRFKVQGSRFVPLLRRTVFVPLLAAVQGSRFKVQGSRFVPCLLEKLPFFALSAASCIVTVIAQKRGGAVATFQMVPLTARFENAAVAYLQYLGKLFWPVNLSPIYLHPAHLDPWLVAGAVTMLVLLSAAAWCWRVRFPFVLAGWLWFLGTLVPVIGLVQVGSQAYADRYTYIPLIGLFLALVWSFECGMRNAALPFRAFRVFRGLTLLFCLVMLALLAWRSSAQLAYWKDTGTLFGRALALDPNNVQALYGLGSYRVENGRLDEGKTLLEQAIRLQPSYPEALGTMANLLDGQGKYQDAIRFYQAALQAQPDQDGVLNNLAWLRASCPEAAFRNGPEAVRLAARACDLTGYSKPLFIGTLAAAQAEAGDFPTAIATAQRAADLATALRLDDLAARNRELIALYRQGKTAHNATNAPQL